MLESAYMADLIDKDLYKLYKPLRNHLRLVSIENAFYVIWAYINNFQFNQSFPKNIDVHEQILKAENIPSRGLFEWELALLAREMISNGETDILLSTKNFNEWNYFIGAINKIKEFENNAWPVYGDIFNINNELRRTAHRQFPWQFKTTLDDFIRCYKIYNNPRISGFVLKRIGITTQQWYTIGIAIFGSVLKYSKINIDPKIEINSIKKEDFDIFLKFTSSDILKLKSIIERDVKFDDEYVYTFNPLEYYPLVKIGIYYYCPIINFLAWRITSGLYFDLVNDKNFGHPFGLAFQDYIEEVSKKILENNKVQVIPEQKYIVSGSEEDSVDLILSQENAALFIEVKTKRLLSKSKSQLASNDAINEDLNVLAEDISKTYCTIQDYKNGFYKHFPYKKDYNIYPIIVTLEDLFLMGENLENLKNKVIEKLKEKEIPVEYINEIPYSLCSSKFYEYLLQTLNHNKISEIMKDWHVPERNGHDFGNFVVTNYGKGCKNLSKFFPDDFKKIYTESQN